MAKSSGTQSGSAVHPMERTGSFRRKGEQKLDGRTVAAICLWLALTVVALAPLLDIVEENPGVSARGDVFTPARIEAVDIEANARAREKARQEYERYWTFQPNVRSKAIERLNICFDIILANKPETGTDVQKIADEIYSKATVRLKNEDLNVLYKNSNLYQLHSDLEKIVERLLSTRIIVGDKGFFTANREMKQVKLHAIPAEFSKLAEDSDPLGWPVDVRRELSENEIRSFYPSGEDRPIVDIAAKLLMQVMGPNFEFDRRRTDENLNELLRAIEFKPAMKIYAPGTAIVRAGDLQTSTHTQALHQVNQMRREAYLYRFAGVIILSVLSFGAAGLYLTRMRSIISLNASNITMMCLPVVLVLTMGRLLIFFAPSELQWVLFPISFIGMLSAVMIG
ncbi:hypothetical protein HY256_11380, partial [Candidatus Sumerlaeota bacterium]|nr:hypothetical protein [Candidatus Sumerlaeota bacterium]